MTRFGETGHGPDQTAGPLTVLHLINHLQWGGIRRHVLDLKEGCAAYGVRSIIAASLPPDDALDGDGDVFDLPLYAPVTSRKSLRGFFQSVRLLRRLVAQEGVQVLHMHSRYATLLAAMVSQDAQLARVYTAHSNFEHLRWLPWYPDTVIVPTAAGDSHFRATVRQARGNPQARGIRI
ncbi:MAG: glycosyltransferase, partial [Bacteroidetes bacterium]|nr:glycosyltransferase [Bacteroidota bacterium]